MPQDESPYMGWLGQNAPGIARRPGELSNNPKDAIGRAKTPMHLIPPTALVEVAKVMGLGAAKYGAYNWRDASVAATVYISAAQRHLAAFLDGENADPESGASHLAHMMACGAILVDAFATGNVVDDRPKPGPTPAMLRGERPAAALDRAMTWAQAEAKIHRAAQGQPVEGALSPMEQELFCMKVKEQATGQRFDSLPPSLTSSDGKHYRTATEAAAPQPFLWYVATPYAACPTGKVDGYHRAAEALAELQRRGVHAFSPIAHNHTAGLSLPQTHEFWMAVDRVFMDRCDGLLVMRQPGWKESKGVTEEVQIFSKAGKPVQFASDPNLWALGEQVRAEAWDDIARNLADVVAGRAA